MNHCFRPLILVALCLQTACLAEDPRSGKSSEPERKAGPAPTVSRHSNAPMNLDPEILASRRFSEAPMLAAQVARGDIPPVSERLPMTPRIIQPIDDIGVYGGTLRRALTGDIVQTAGPSKTMNENLLGYSRPLPDSIVHELAEHYAFSDSGRTITLRVRQGLRWSDGHPFGVDDMLFWYNDFILDPNARTSTEPPFEWLADGTPFRMEKIDDRTVAIHSTKPLGRILHTLCRDLIALPRHRFEHLHPRHNPEATYDTFRDSTTDGVLMLKPGIPRMSAWHPVEWLRGQRVVYERNPYYWKVDTQGNQLPYADSLVFNVIQDVQVILLRFTNGELDLFGRYTRSDMFPVLKFEERNGKFKLRITAPNRGPAFHLNWDAPNPALREAFRTLEVRQALSHAINRDEIDEIVFHGLLEPSGYSIGPISPYHDPVDYLKYSQYDPVLANRLLDEAGYLDSDGDGFRELLDGTRFELTIDFVHPGGFFNGGPVSELVADHWAAIGIKVNLNGGLRDIIVPRRYNNEFDVHYWGLEGANDPLMYPIGWGILGPNVPYWHQNASKEGPKWLWEATDAIKLAMTTTDTVQRRAHMDRLRRLHTDNVPIILIGSVFNVWGANTRLGNVPWDNVADNAFLGWSRPVFHEQIYIKPDHVVIRE